MTEIGLVIFDLDGTLLDTETLSTKAIEMVLEKFQVFGFDWDLKKRLLGLRGPDWSKIVIHEMGIADKITSQELVAQWEYNLGELCEHVHEMTGADVLTSQLHAQGVRMAITTSSSSVQVEKKKLNHQALFDRMEMVVCGDDSEVHNGKPAPDMYLLTARRMGINPSHCLVFEDALAGVQSGVAAGMHVVAVPDPRLMQDPEQQKRFYDLTPHLLPRIDDVLKSVETAITPDSDIDNTQMETTNSHWIFVRDHQKITE